MKIQHHFCKSCKFWFVQVLQFQLDNLVHFWSAEGAMSLHSQWTAASWAFESWSLESWVCKLFARHPPPGSSTHHFLLSGALLHSPDTHTERHREYSTINLLGEKLKTRSEKARNVIRLWNKQIYANIIFADLFKIAKWCWGRGWAQRRAMPEDSNRKKSASIQPRAIPAEFSTASNFWPNFASIILRTSSAGTQFRSFERTQSSAKWYAVRYEVEDGRRERRRWWWRWRGCLYT